MPAPLASPFPLMGVVHLISVPSLLEPPPPPFPLTPASSCGWVTLQVLGDSPHLLYQTAHEGRVLLLGGRPPFFSWSGAPPLSYMPCAGSTC